MNNLSSSELIYLYVDGEADAGQQAALFAALAHDSDLQAEFNDALAMRLSLSTEVRNTVPAPALKNTLLQKAGFSVDATAGAAGTVGAASHTAVSASAAGVSVAVGGWLGVKSMMLPVLAVLSGVLMFATGAVLWYNSTETASVVQPSARESAVHAPVAEPFTADNGQVDDRASAQADAVDRIPEAGRGVSGAVRYIPSRAGRRDGTENRSVADVAEPEQAVNSDSADENNETVALGPVLLTSVATIAPEQQVRIAAAVPEELGDMLGEAPASLSDDEGSSWNWGLQARGIIGLQLFPWREMGVASDVFDNTALGAVWVIDDEHAAGIEVGREVLPMFLISDGVLRETQSVIWGGVTYRYSPSLIQLSDGLQPFVSGFAGGSISGPILKSAVGLLWKPDTHIQFSLGAEGTFLMYQYKQQWYGTQKIGLSYGVTIVF